MHRKHHGNLPIPVLRALIALVAISTCREPEYAQRLLVVNKSGSSLSIVDPISRRESAVVPTGYAPHEVAVSPDGRKSLRD